ncbi:hypothetical protein JG687_00001843 [Phytophthora cactorum]|uniref:Uncharacterized protein n=1 Tax=Phytophthora cactorum TaxID=29920 RepID=A0A8T1V012_9STRA|nr:hypothetical protein PC120_g21028 [Phytophthora cactorum]KAG3048231.1 hypothetical protein PC121_g19620 [Phytophthora cactorum]KAG4044194.1 hypothetical protein PC123_g20347 [Phytophthora cactorum]KAG6971787.1 hypothetical protein JG687_00001843 [Phytophthora cactorum]
MSVTCTNSCLNGCGGQPATKPDRGKTTFVIDPRQVDRPGMTEGKPNSGMEAVAKGTLRLLPNDDGRENETVQRLYELCLQPVVVLSQLRERTEEEARALLIHESMVPFPPRFQVQSMNANEMVRFTDIFMELEYPLYAYLVPGQRYWANMTKSAILAQIHVGDSRNEAAVSRIMLNIETRVLTITFKEKKTLLDDESIGRCHLPCACYPSLTMRDRGRKPRSRTL